MPRNESRRLKTHGAGSRVDTSAIPGVVAARPTQGNEWGRALFVDHGGYARVGK